MNKHSFNAINTLSVLDSGREKQANGKCSIYRIDDNEAKAVTAVFEGCGRYSDVRYAEFDNRTDANIGSRIVAAATLNWFNGDKCNLDDYDADHLRNSIDLLIRKAKRELDYEGNGLLSKKAKTFNTSAAICAVDYFNEDSALCEFLWAGNCRGYVLDEYGLCQLTDDDINGIQDAYLNQAAGAKLNNVINGDINYVINFRRINITAPMMLITATTAAFDDFNSPMEFEYAILYALIKSKNIDEWDKRLTAIIKEYAGDDFSMTIMSIGFDDFGHMKKYYEPRIKQLVEEYIRPLNSARKGESRINIRSLWNKYKDGYYR